MRTAILAVTSAAILLATTSCTKSPPQPTLNAKPLLTLEQALPAQLNAERRKQGLPGGWNGKHVPLSSDVEKTLGADDYLNLKLEAPEGEYTVVAFVTYNANPRSLVPHVPWVALSDERFRAMNVQERNISITSMPGKEIPANVVLLEKPEFFEKALTFQYFNVGGAYRTSRESSRILANSGRGHPRSFMSQTQVIVWLPPGSTEDPFSKDSTAYRLGVEVLNALVPLLEKDYYPDVGKDAKD